MITPWTMLCQHYIFSSGSNFEHKNVLWLFKPWKYALFLALSKHSIFDASQGMSTNSTNDSPNPPLWHAYAAGIQNNQRLNRLDIKAVFLLTHFSSGVIKSGLVLQGNKSSSDLPQGPSPRPKSKRTQVLLMASGVLRSLLCGNKVLRAQRQLCFTISFFHRRN